VIKIASMVGAPDLETPTLAPYSGDLATAFKKLAALGFEGVELMTKRPALLDGPGLVALLAEYRLQLTGLCSGHIFGEDRLGLVTPDLSINSVALERLKEFVDFAAAYLPSGKMVNIGRSRGVGDPSNPAGTMKTAAQAIRELADYAQPKGVRLILEPVSKKEVNFIHSTQDGLRLVEMVDRPNFGLMVDTYHMYHEDQDLLQSFYEAAPFIWHVHFSDSNRRYPGSGEIDYEKVIQVLEAIGYDGFVSLEIQAWPDPDESARRSIEYLRRYIPADAASAVISAGA
jgi:sugar phosphate isomerase/epimerase